MKHLIILFTLILLCTPAFVEETNYCHDKESWKEWNELARKYPHDMNIQFLHAVRIGFCEKIKNGTIELDVASGVFNKLRENVLQGIEREGEKQKENSEL